MRSYLAANQQLEGVVNGGAFVKQKRFKLHLLDIIERIEHHCQELDKDRENDVKYKIRQERHFRSSEKKANCTRFMMK